MAPPKEPPPHAEVPGNPKKRGRKPLSAEARAESRKQANHKYYLKYVNLLFSLYQCIEYMLDILENDSKPPENLCNSLSLVILLYSAF